MLTKCAEVGFGTIEIDCYGGAVWAGECAVDQDG